MTNQIDSQPALYVTRGGTCALFVNGKRAILGDPSRLGWNSIDLTPAVRRLIEMAGVRLVKDVDPRALARDHDTRRPAWRETQAEVEARLVELAEAEALREAAKEAQAKAERLEGVSR